MSNNSSLWSDAFYRLTRNKAAMIGGGILILLILCAVLAPWIAPYSYSYQDLDLGASPPSAEHILGTDILGRDLLSRILYGARVSLLVGFVATGVALVIGVSWWPQISQPKSGAQSLVCSFKISSGRTIGQTCSLEVNIAKKSMLHALCRAKKFKRLCTRPLT